MLYTSATSVQVKFSAGLFHLRVYRPQGTQLSSDKQAVAACFGLAVRRINAVCYLQYHDVFRGRAHLLVATHRR